VVTTSIQREFTLWLAVGLILLATRVIAAEPLPLQKFEQKLAASLQKELARQTAFKATDLEVKFESAQVRPKLPTEAADLVVIGLGTSGSQRLSGLVSLTVRAATREGTQDLQVTGLLNVIGPVAVADRMLVRGFELKPEDLKVARMDWAKLPNGAQGLKMNDITGRRLRGSVNAGDPLFKEILETAMMVKTGDSVQITVVSGPGIMIRSKGVAKQEGRIGDLIRIEQPETKRSLSAYITGDKSVEVRL
jgi:flagella basal body P-ring formation protein FlgA